MFEVDSPLDQSYHCGWTTDCRFGARRATPSAIRATGLVHHHPRRGAMSIGAPVSAESLLAWLVRVSPIRAKQVVDMARWLNRGAPHQQRRLSRFARCKWTRMKQMICLKGLSAKHQLAVQPPKRRRRRRARYA